MDEDKEILDEFIASSKEHLESIEEDFLLLETQQDNPDHTLVDKVFRAIHSIKGGAGFLGFIKMNDLAHVMETLLSMIRSGEIKPQSCFIDALLSGVDLIKVMLDNIENCNTINIVKVHKHISNLINLEEDETSKERKQSVSLYDQSGEKVSMTIDSLKLQRLPQNINLYLLKFDLSKLPNNKSPVKLVKDILEYGEILESQFEVEANSFIDEISNEPLIYYIIYSSFIEHDDLIKKLQLKEEEISEVTREHLEKRTEEKQISKTSQIKDLETSELITSSKSNHEQSNTIRIHVDILDKLMTLAGELVLVRNQQLLSVDKSDPISRSIAQRLDIVTSELQENIMRTRMQPIGKVFSKFPRIVRELSKKLSKKIEISISGNEVELDKTILESLSDPLTHIIRNCCDHGIELPQLRQKAGKNEEGNISLSAYHEAGQINIKIKDDGKGIDPEIIKKKVLEKGLKTEAELEKLSDKEVLSLILASGFSTTSEVSDISGRGVGMDVVKTSIENLGGILDIESTPGENTIIHLRLPLTLAIIPCLIVTVGNERYAIPQVNLEELVCLYDEDVVKKIECAGDQEVYRLRKKLLPMVRLQEVLKNSKAFTDTKKSEITEYYRKKMNEEYQAFLQQSEKQKIRFNKSLNFAVLRVGANRFGLIIDNVLGTEEIVVKPMHPTLKPLKIYSGATVMGDGKVALILDVEGIARHVGAFINSSMDESITKHHDETSSDDIQTILLFKNGRKEQFAMPLPLIRRIERIEKAQIEKIGNTEFITIAGVSTRILRLDNVLNVSSCEEKEEMFLILPKHIKRPIGLLASSLIDIDEITVKLATDSYIEEGILGTTIIRERMTIFIDIYKLTEKADPEWFSERKLKAPPPKEKKRILFLEDASFFRQLVKGYLNADGYEVVDVENGKKGLEKFEVIDFDLIVSDIEMPIMNGLEFIKHIRKGEKNPNIKALALTSLDSDRDREKALDSGFNEYQVKVDRETLLVTVSKLL